MAIPQTTRTAALEPVPAAWLAGGVSRAVETVLVARLERRRIRVVDGAVVNRDLDGTDALDGALLDALGARGRRDLETVRWRLSRDHRVDRVRVHLTTDGLLGERTGWGRAGTPERPACTAAGRRALRELRADPPDGAVWEVALHGRTALTDLALRGALEPPARPPLPAQPRRSWLAPRRDRYTSADGYASGAAVVSYWGGGFGDGVGGCGDGGFGGGGDGGGGGAC